MELSYEPRTNDMLITLRGRLTSDNVYTFNAEMKKMMERYGIPCAVTIDMRDVVYINASALRALYYFVRFIFRRGGTMSFYGHEGITEHFIALSGITYPYAFHIVESLKA